LAFQRNHNEIEEGEIVDEFFVETEELHHSDRDGQQESEDDDSDYGMSSSYNIRITNTDADLNDLPIELAPVSAPVSPPVASPLPTPFPTPYPVQPPGPLPSVDARSPLLNQFQNLTSRVLQQVLNPNMSLDAANSQLYYDASNNEFVVQGFFFDANHSNSYANH